MHRQILIVEDHPIVSESLTRLFEGSAYELACFNASSGGKGLAFLNGNTVDLVILDIHLPDMDGIEFCRMAKKRFPGLKIVAVTTVALRHVVEEMLDEGADGFILKTTDTVDILEGVMQVMNTGELYLGIGVRELIRGVHTLNSDLPVITRRECDILKLIADGMTNKEIADKLFISSLTVDTHRKNLLLKFQAKNTASLVKIAVSKGYINL